MAAACADPGGEHAVRVVSEVVPCEFADALRVVGQVSRGDRHELALARCPSQLLGAREQVVVVREDRGGDEQGDVVAAVGVLDDRGGGEGVADDYGLERVL